MIPNTPSYIQNFNHWQKWCYHEFPFYGSHRVHVRYMVLCRTPPNISAIHWLKFWQSQFCCYSSGVLMWTVISQKRRIPLPKVSAGGRRYQRYSWHRQMLSTPYVQGRAGQGRQEGRQNQASKQASKTPSSFEKVCTNHRRKLLYCKLVSIRHNKVFLIPGLNDSPLLADTSDLGW